jgi:hypothetical protein
MATVTCKIFSKLNFSTYDSQTQTTMKKTFLLIVTILMLLNSKTNGQTIYKPKGCSASTGPSVSTTVLNHPQDRYHLLTTKWSDIEPFPGVFDFTNLQNQISTVTSYGKKYVLAIASGGTGSPSWLIDTFNVPYVDYLFHSNSLKLPVWWDTTVQQRISSMVTALGNQFANDTSLALVYVTQMSANGIEGHLNGINMDTMYNHGFTPAKWINAAKQTTYCYTNSFPDKAIAFEVHEVDTSAIIPSTIINDLYNDTSLCQRVGAATWWLSGKTTYQTDLLTVLQNYQGDKYAQLIGKSSQPERFKDSLIATAFTQAKQLGIRYIEPWLYEYQNNTINNVLLDFNNWADSIFSSYYTCNLTTGVNELPTTESNFSVYPNPANSVVHVYTGNEKIKIIKLFNMQGLLIQKYFTNDFSVSNFPDGIYFVIVETDNSIYTNKLIKQP